MKMLCVLVMEVVSIYIYWNTVDWTLNERILLYADYTTIRFLKVQQKLNKSVHTTVMNEMNTFQVLILFK